LKNLKKLINLKKKKQLKRRAKMALKREEIQKEDKWNVEAIYESDQQWEKDFNIAKEKINEITQFKGKLKDSAKNIKNMIDKLTEIERFLNKIYLYAHMRHDEDTRNEKYKDMEERISTLLTKYDEISSYIGPELISIEDSIMNKYLDDEILRDYRFYLHKILRAKDHILSEKEEKLISMASNVFFSISDSFRSLNDADIKFGTIKIYDKELELTHSKYYTYLIDRNREIRKHAFKSYHNKFNEYPTTFASLLYGEIKSHYFYAKARNFKSSLEASLFYKNIDTKVYTNLIDTVRKGISALHNYLSYRKKRMGLDELHLYDVYVPFIEAVDIKFSYNEAQDTVLESVKLLGDEYYSTLKRGLKEERWVDKYENENKRSGAYSTGCYDSYPYILMNFNGTLNDAKTLSHEAGHSMHSYLTNKNQPFIYSGYPIFLAEIASTFNEELFIHYLIDKSKDKKEKAYLINSRLEEIRTTFFRQTMFAEFELLIHNLVENDIPLTFQLLKNEYRKLNEYYFGKDVVIDPEIEIEWARIPHFYYNYYVYQYATGISAAITLFKKVLNGGEKERNDYLNFLKSGNSKFPLDILKEAGIDMSTPEPIENTIRYFEELTEELKKLE